jgi:hypothetical protein
MAKALSSVWLSTPSSRNLSLEVILPDSPAF